MMIDVIRYVYKEIWVWSFFKFLREEIRLGWLVGWLAGWLAGLCIYVFYIPY
jgi:hypothetical protein